MHHTIRKTWLGRYRVLGPDAVWWLASFRHREHAEMFVRVLEMEHQPAITVMNRKWGDEWTG